MTQKFLLLFLCLLFYTEIIKAQPYLSVIAPAGSATNGTAILLDWTLGELTTQSLQVSDGILTEGFHQPMLVVESLSEATELHSRDDFKVLVFPNPTSSRLFISLDSKLKGEGILSLKTEYGQNVHSETINLSSGSQELNFNQYPTGLYLLSLQTEKGELLKSLKVAKIH